MNVVDFFKNLLNNRTVIENTPKSQYSKNYDFGVFLFKEDNYEVYEKA